MLIKNESKNYEFYLNRRVTEIVCACRSVTHVGWFCHSCVRRVILQNVYTYSSVLQEERSIKIFLHRLEKNNTPT